MPVAQERKPFKDWFDRVAARSLASQVRSADPSFDEATFVRRATKGLGALEFQGRVQRFADALRSTLPEDVPSALDVLTRSLPPPLPNCDSVTDGWLQWPVGQFIADHGVAHFDASMAAMLELTQRFSSEFAVRPFVERHPAETFARLEAWTTHPSPHVRRWCSEGVRPRLPWGKKLRALIEDPAPIFPILEALRDDPEPYVRRSVGNNLNDIAKDDPEAVLRTCGEWLREPCPEGRRWVVTHGLRTLVKQGDPKALSLIGFVRPSSLTAELTAAASVAIGDDLILVAQLKNTSKRAQPLLVDYVVHFVRKSGQQHPKVFKWGQRTLAGGEQTSLRKLHRFRETTVRRLYAGPHLIELQVNGVVVASVTVQVRE